VSKARVAVRKPLRARLGLTPIEDVQWRTETPDPYRYDDPLADTVQAAAARLGATDPLLVRALIIDTSSDQLAPLLDHALPPGGWSKHYAIPAAAYRADRLTVTIKARLGALMHSEGHTPHAGIIHQSYVYLQTDRSVTSGRGGSGAGHAAFGLGVKGGTGRAVSSTGTVHDQTTVLQRNSDFGGVERVSQSVRLDITVSRGSKQESATLVGDLVRLLPVGSVVSVDRAPRTPVVSRDHRPARLPEMLTVDAVSGRDTLRSAALAGLRELGLSRAQVRQSEHLVHAQLGRATQVGLDRMSWDGVPLVRITGVGRKSRVAVVRVQAKLYERRVLSDGHPAELGRIDRHQQIVGTSQQRSSLLPVTRSVDALGVTAGSGQRSGQQVHDETGARIETTNSERGPNVAVEYDIAFHLVAELHEPGGGLTEETLIRQVLLPQRVHGIGVVTMPRPALAAVRAAQEQAADQPWPLSSAADRAAAERALRQAKELPDELASTATRLGAYRRAAERVADWPDPIVLRSDAGEFTAVGEALLLAREVGRQIWILTGQRSYLVRPDGTVRAPEASVLAEHALAAALSTLPPHLLRLADEHDLDLRAIDAERGAATLADAVRAALRDGGFDPDPPKPGWPVPTRPLPPGHDIGGGSTYSTTGT